MRIVRQLSVIGGPRRWRLALARLVLTFEESVVTVTSKAALSLEENTFVGCKEVQCHERFKTTGNGFGGGSSSTHGMTITPMMTGAADKNNFVVSSSFGPQNFLQRYLNNLINPHLQHQQQDNINFRDDGTFEYEGGVALQTALNVFLDP